MVHVESKQQIILALQSLDELFKAPAEAPMRGAFEDQSCFDRLVDDIHPRNVSHHLHISIHVHRGDGESDLSDRVQRAIQGACGTQIRRLRKDYARVIRQGRKELEFRVVFLSFCLITAALIDVATRIPHWGRPIVGEGIVIVGWIAPWHPVDLLLFERGNVVRDESVVPGPP